MLCRSEPLQWLQISMWCCSYGHHAHAVVRTSQQVYDVKGMYHLFL